MTNETTNRPMKWMRFKTHAFQHFIIQAGKEGMPRAKVESDWVPLFPPSQRDRLTNSEWALVKKWLASLGYTYNRRFFWIHPHFHNKEIPLIPLQLLDNPNDYAHNMRAVIDNAPSIEEVMAEIKADEIQIPEHTRADGSVTVKAHTRTAEPKRKKKRGRPKGSKTKKKTFTNPDDGSGRVKTVRIRVPRGVKVMVEYE